MSLEEIHFWTTFSCVAATLAGFTLAGYGLYAGRIEQVKGKEICRRYALKDGTSHFSFSSILLAIALLIVPLLFGLLKLTPASLHSSRFLGQTVLWGMLIVLVLAALTVVTQLLYLYRRFSFFRRTKSLHRQLRTLKRQPPKARRARPFRWWRILPYLFVGVLYTFFLALSVMVLCLDFRAFIEMEALAPVPPLASGMLMALPPASEELLACCSLVLGVTMVGFHYFIFTPSDFLFSVDENTKGLLFEIKGDIESKCAGISSIAPWLLRRLHRVENRLNNRGDLRQTDHSVTLLERIIDGLVLLATGTAEEENEAECAIKLLQRARSYLEPGPERELTLVANRHYHLAQVHFLLGSRYLNHEGAVGILTGLEIYTRGLAKFESWLKEMPVLLDQLEHSAISSAA